MSHLHFKLSQCTTQNLLGLSQVLNHQDSGFVVYQTVLILHFTFLPSLLPQHQKGERRKRALSRKSNIKGSCQSCSVIMRQFLQEQGEMSFVLFFYFLSLSASSSAHVLVGRHHEYIFSDAQGFSFANPITAVD